METLTKEKSIEFAESNVWKHWTAEQIINFQFSQKWLCIDFKTFQKALESVLNRPVPVCEFNFPDLLKKEYLRTIKKASLTT